MMLSHFLIYMRQIYFKILTYFKRQQKKAHQFCLNFCLFRQANQLADFLF